MPFWKPKARAIGVFSKLEHKILEVFVKLGLEEC